MSDSYAPVYEPSGSIKFGRFFNQRRGITAYSNLDFVELCMFTSILICLMDRHYCYVRYWDINVVPMICNVTPYSVLYNYLRYKETCFEYISPEMSYLFIRLYTIQTIVIVIVFL